MAELDPEGHWEIYDGDVREKPGMSFAHNDVATELGYMLRSQLSRVDFVVWANMGRIRQGTDSSFIRDVYVARRPRKDVTAERLLEVYETPLLLVVEIWSPSTGLYDVGAKLPRYQARRDAEIWHMQPIERELQRWVLTEDTTYTHSVLHGGVVTLSVLPGVRIDLDGLFAFG